jgi:ParB/RepB/Spo0J family partition protein
MNAPAAPAAVAAVAKLELIPIGKLRPSRTHIQELRRARFDKKTLQELAESIKKVGILQPLVARPLGLNEEYEIVAGERRYLAGKLAGLTTIPANVAILTPEQVLEVQLIENLQREGLHELEEAEGYEELMKLKKIGVEDLAAMVGKSRSYVYARTKLISLGKEGREAFYGGALDASRALLLARIPSHEIQARALQSILTQGEEMQNDKGRWVQGPMSFREAQVHIGEKYTANLKKAVFDIKDATLLPRAGSCESCPKRSGNMKDLQVETRNADVCTDTKCFDGKRQAHIEIDRRRLINAGNRVLSAEEVKQAFPYFEKNGSTGLDERYLELSRHTYVGHRHVRISDVVGKDYKPILIHNPSTGDVMKVATKQAVAAAVGKSHAASRPSESYRPKPSTPKGPDVDEQEMAALIRLIHEKAPKQFGMTHLRGIARRLFQIVNPRRYGLEGMKAAWKWSSLSHSHYNPKLPADALKLNERDLTLFILDVLFVGCYSMERKPLLDLFGISEKKVREQVIEERRKATVAAREKAKAAREAKKAKAGAAKVIAEIEKRVASGKPTWASPVGASGTTQFKSFMKPVQPSIQLAAIVGHEPLVRTDVTKKIWGYIKKHGLQDKKNRRMINTDAKLAAIFGTSKAQSMFSMTQLVGKHLAVVKGTGGKAKKSKAKKTKGRKK